MADSTGFQMSGFDVLTMTSFNSRFSLSNDGFTHFTSVDLNIGYLQTEYIVDC